MLPLNEKTPLLKDTLPFWRLAFRSFFAGACLFSVIAIALWWANLRAYLTIDIYGNWLWWHSHEMIFGFACAIVSGFLLTAVQTWTGIAGIRGKPLAALFAVWLSARLAMFLPLPSLVIALLDTSFLLIVALVLAQSLLKVRMYRNMVFIIVLLLLMSLNIASHLALSNNLNSSTYFHSAIMLIVLIITIMGGRVIPLFTANALKIKVNKTPKIIELAAITSTVLLVLYTIVGFSLLPKYLLACVTAVGIISHSVRLGFWFNKGILNKPILWALHLAYGFIPLGLLLMFLQSISINSITTSLVIHSFTVGGVGGLILAMISRVALGHTGRALILPKPMALAFSVLFLGGFIRALLPLLNMKFYNLAIDASALCWGLAFSLFLFCYLPFLVSTRADGKTT